MYKAVLREEGKDLVLSKVPGLDRQSMIIAFQRFDAVVVAPDELILPQVCFLDNEQNSTVVAGNQLLCFFFLGVLACQCHPEGSGNSQGTRTRH